MTQTPILTLPSTVCDAVIDVSHHNGVIDWPAVAEAGIALVFIKATQGTGFIDPRFAAHCDRAAAAGVLVVPYHFLDTSDPKSQAAHFLDVTALAAGQPAMVDWETSADADAVVQFGQAVIDGTGRVPVAYYGYAQLQETVATLTNWPLMLPEYPRGNTRGSYANLVKRPPRLPPGRAVSWTNGARPYDFHQYTPAGRVSGIATPVDRSVWVGDLASLKAWYGGTPAA